MQPTTQNAWHVTRGGQTYGPYTWEQIAEHARGGRIGRGDKIFDPRNGVWTKPTQVPGLFGPGGVATVPVGISAAAKVAVGIVLGLVFILSAAFLFMWRTDPAWWMKAGQHIAHNDTPITSIKAEVPPEGLTYKGTFHWQSTEGPDVPHLWHDDPCYLWIYTVDDGTAANFDFGTVDGYPVYLVSHTGSNYVFESSNRSRVEHVRIIANVTDTSMSGSVTNITPDTSSFVDGTFTGTAIPYEQYQAETQ